MKWREGRREKWRIESKSFRSVVITWLLMGIGNRRRARVHLTFQIFDLFNVESGMQLLIKPF